MPLDAVEPRYDLHESFIGVHLGPSEGEHFRPAQAQVEGGDVEVAEAGMLDGGEESLHALPIERLHLAPPWSWSIDADAGVRSQDLPFDRVGERLGQQPVGVQHRHVRQATLS